MTVSMGGRALPSESGFRTALVIGCGVALVAALVTLILPKHQRAPEPAAIRPAPEPIAQRPPEPAFRGPVPQMAPERAAKHLPSEATQPFARATRAMAIGYERLGPWENAFRANAPEPAGNLTDQERAELSSLRAENAELRRELDVLMQSVSIWVKSLAER